MDVHLRTPQLPLAPTKIQHLQATQVAGIVHHSGAMVQGQVPQISKVPIFELPIPKLPDHLHKVKGAATPPCFGHVKMEERDPHHKISLVYIG
mgnify:FL=1|jgi:hypothetical protein